MSWRWFGVDGLLALAGLATAGLLAYASVILDGGLPRLVAIDLLCSLVIGAVGGIVISIRAVRAGRPRRRGDGRLVLGQTATSVLIACVLCVLGSLAAGAIAYPEDGLRAVFLLGAPLGVLAVLMVGLPVGLATGLVNGCRLMSRSR
jgi:hypothetical protein